MTKGSNQIKHLFSQLFKYVNSYVELSLIKIKYLGNTLVVQWLDSGLQML